MLRITYGIIHALAGLAFLFVAASVIIMQSGTGQALMAYVMTALLSLAVSAGFFLKNRLLAALPALPLFLISLTVAVLCFIGSALWRDYNVRFSAVMIVLGFLGCALELSAFFLAFKNFNEGPEQQS